MKHFWILSLIEHFVLWNYTWFSRKYVWILWSLHKDHHVRSGLWFERNDFFHFYARLVWLLYLWAQLGFVYGFYFNGIFLRINLFVVHDI